MPDVICHGGGELSESRHGEDGTDGQRPETNTPETSGTFAEELSSKVVSKGGVPATGGDETIHDAAEGEQGVEDQPEPEFISPINFKTSGTFFRDRVARTLTEQGFAPSEGFPSEELPSEVPADIPATEAQTAEDTSTWPAATDRADGTGTEEPGADTESGREGSPSADTPVADESVADHTAPLSTDAVMAAAVVSSEAEDDRDAADTLDGMGSDPAQTQPFSAQADGDGNAGDGTPSREGRTAEKSSRSQAAEEPTTAQDSGPTPAALETAASDRPGAEETDETTAAETVALWPAPRRFSDYASESPITGRAAAGTGAASSVSPGGAGASRPSEGDPGMPQGAHRPQEVPAVSQQGPTGPGGPKGPAGPGGTGPGGPKGPGDPKAGGGRKNGKKAKKPLWWRMLRSFLVAIGLFVAIACGAFAYLYATVEVPDAAKADVLEQGSTFYFADGETEFAYRGTNREIISYDEMTEGGDHIVEAVISAEDRGFWTEPGVSVSGTTRAFWSTVTGKQVQGGSTITQQMVRNYYEGISKEQTITRKVREIFISIKVDQSESKEWVMEQYLNTIYFGRNAYGIQAAAQAYYHKDVQELEPVEAAFLAAAIQQPTYFGEADVETTPEMERRWQYVVKGLVTTDAITQAEADEMEFPAPEAERPSAGNDLSGYKGYMLQEAMNELDRLGYTEDQVNRQGYTVVTTFDKAMMDAAYETVEETVPPENLPEGVNIGLTTIDPATGEVLAFYGGHDYWENQYDSAFLGAAQAGSAFKPYVLATALEQGYGLNSTVDGRGPRQIQGSQVQNAGNSPGGIMTLTQATQVSNNLGYVELAQEVGFENIRDTAYAVGWPEGSIADNQLVPVMPLGAASVRPVDQASGYATFANGGVHVDAHVVKEIINTSGENERPDVESSRALKEETAADVTYALQQVVNGGTGTAARLWDHPTAGKTGTTDGSVAAWFTGYTPQLSTAVGVYSGDNESFSIPGHNISGGGLPATLWNRYMAKAMEGYESGSFPSPAFGGSTENWAPDPSTQEPEEPQQPEQPEQPEQPGAPIEPEVPIDPIDPIDPVDPGEPIDPVDPGEPGIPDIPGPPPGRGDETL